VFEHFALHPGGAKVLRAYEDLFGAGRPDIAAAWSTLADYGNMSSPTVLFVLDRLLRQTTPRRALGLVLGLGPGFSIEGVSFRW
jgi:alkylresorcinol/alkylpyrone synthase